MGYSQSSIAIKGKSPGAVLEILGVQRTGAREEFAESPIVGAELPDGWYLVVSQKDKLGLMKESTLRRLSADAEVVACEVWDSTMYSGATCWRNGQQVWSVIHNSQDPKHGNEHLEANGQLPEIFVSIRDQWFSEQQNREGRNSRVDFIIEIPVDLARALTGYRHDREVVGLGEQPFEVLIVANPPAASPVENKGKSWLSRLFGG